MKAEDCPSYRYINLGEDMTKYKPENDDITTDAVKSFVQGVLDGKVCHLDHFSSCLESVLTCATRPEAACFSFNGKVDSPGTKASTVFCTYY